MSDARVEVPDGLAYDDGQRDTAAADWDFSLAIPFMDAPKYRSFDVKMAGDAGFDPFSFADRPATLKKMRDAELKHGRLATVQSAHPTTHPHHAPAPRPRADHALRLFQYARCHRLADSRALR